MNLVTIKKKLQKTIIPEEIRAAGVIPVLAYSEDDYAFLMDDKSIGFGFLCQPLNSATEKVQERTVGMLNQEFPAKSTMQFTLFRSPDITQDLYRMIELRDGYQHDLLSSVIRERTEFLKHHTREKIVAHNERGYYDREGAHQRQQAYFVRIERASGSAKQG